MSQTLPPPSTAALHKQAWDLHLVPPEPACAFAEEALACGTRNSKGFPLARAALAKALSEPIGVTDLRCHLAKEAGRAQVISEDAWLAAH